MASKQTTLQDALQYPQDVIDKKTTVCELVRLACKRHFNDVARSREPDSHIRFNIKKAKKALKFFSLCCHVKGDLARKPIELMHWQAFMIASLHGWEMKRSGRWTRRFRKFYAEVARKNAKSTLLSGLGLFASGFDGEGGAEVYSVATTKDQAKIVWGDAYSMVRASPPLSLLFKLRRTDITEELSNSIFKALASDDKSLDGLNTHFGIIDEYHSHRTSAVYDVIESSTGARTNPMVGIITTAGFNLQSPCFTLRKQYIEPLLRGAIEDDSYFALVYTLDDDDDPFDESVWIKANPSLGISKGIDTMREEAAKAQHMPSAKANFLTKHCNVWVQSSGTFIDLGDWAECPESLPDEDLAQQQVPCYISIDLARQWDWTAVVCTFKCPDGTIDIRPYLFLPEETLDNVPKQLKQVYDKFVADGSLILTSGNVVDLSVIKDQILDLHKTYNVQEVGYDSYMSSMLITELQQEGCLCVSVSQGAKVMSPAMNEVASRVLQKTIRNPQSSAFTWHLGNVILRHADAKNMTPTKAHADNKIDGAVALFMGVNRILNSSVKDLSGFLSFDQ
ncbi:terminase large subunit [Vibrio mytili]|uniref:terminase large subunit n=1 Tax=Vibrio mytili TaxID=50718 RepID=UPI002F3E8D6C